MWLKEQFVISPILTVSETAKIPSEAVTHTDEWLQPKETTE